MHISFSDPTVIRSYLKPEHQSAYDTFRADHAQLDSDAMWEKHYNDGNFQDPTQSPFWLLTSSDETFYCLENGYFNDMIFNDLFRSLDTGEQVAFIEEWVNEYDQQL